MDTEYLQKQVGGCLVECLAEVVQKRPFDPIEYIAQYLYKYLDNQENAKTAALEADQLELQQREYAEEEERVKGLLEEQRQLQEQEENQQKAKLELERRAAAREATRKKRKAEKKLYVKQRSGRSTKITAQRSRSYILGGADSKTSGKIPDSSSKTSIAERPVSSRSKILSSNLDGRSDHDIRGSASATDA